MDFDFCFCIPIFIGCPTKYSQDSEGGARVCPRCHNASVTPAKAKTWLELCCVPVVPMKSKDVWICGICQWEMKQGEGFEPPYPGQGGPPPGQWGGQQWGGNYQQQPGYAPQYQPQQMSHGPPGGPGQYQQPGYGH